MINNIASLLTFKKGDINKTNLTIIVNGPKSLLILAKLFTKANIPKFTSLTIM